LTDRFTPLDQKVIILRTIWNMIDDMMNFGVLEKLSRHTEDP